MTHFCVRRNTANEGFCHQHRLRCTFRASNLSTQLPSKIAASSHPDSFDWGSVSWELGSAGLRSWRGCLLVSLYLFTRSAFERSRDQLPARSNDLLLMSALYIHGARLQYSPLQSKIAAPLQLEEALFSNYRTPARPAGRQQPPWTARQSRTRSRKTGSTS